MTIAGQTFTVGQSGTGNLSISGIVTYGRSYLAGVTVTLSGAASKTAVTDSQGNYSFGSLGNGTYTVTPGKTGYSFTPANRTVTLNGASATGQNFAATLGGGGGTFSISGTVTISGGGALAGVTMSLSGAAGGSTTTNASGVYTFAGLSNGSYTVTPAMAGYTFSPVNRNVSINNANVTGQNFTATPTGGTFSISGTVTSGGNGLSGVTMTLSGDAGAVTSTDANGNYTFSGLGNGNYTVVPTMTGYAFSPASQPVSIVGASVSGVNFTGTPAGGTFSISGRVTAGTIGLSGVTMVLSGAASKTTLTDANGNYTFTALGNGSYTITPGKSGYTFTPMNREVSINGASVAGQNFTAARAR